MSYIYPKNKAVYLLAGIIGVSLNLTGCGGSSDDVAQVIADEFVTVSGKVTNLNDTGEPDVRLEGIYDAPGDILNPKTDTDTNGNFSLSVLKDDAVFLQARKSGFAIVNSQKVALATNVTELDIGLPTEGQAQDVIDNAFTSMPALQNHAWLVVEIEDANGDGVSGQTVSVNSATVAGEVYTECDGTDGGATSTTGPCPSDRVSPMYIAYFDVASEATVTVGSETQTAPIRMGEITALEFEVAIAPVGSIAAGQAKYDADCASCHAAGSYDPSQPTDPASDLDGKSNLIIPELSTLPGMKSGVSDITQQQVLDLKAFLDSL